VEQDSKAALRAFHWQNGYGGFSVSPQHVQAAAEYIGQQEEHHRRTICVGLTAEVGSPLQGSKRGGWTLYPGCWLGLN
jgi:hypothetical protein